LLRLGAVIVTFADKVLNLSTWYCAVHWLDAFGAPILVAELSPSVLVRVSALAVKDAEVSANDPEIAMSR
jgi:hypothetical protein